MKNATAGPCGLMLWSLFLCGCNGGNDEVPTVRVSVFFQARATIPNVQMLEVRVSPLLMFLDCAADPTRCGDHYVLMTDDRMQDTSHAPNADLCRTVWVYEQGKEPRRTTVCDDYVKYMGLTNTTIANPLYPTPFGRNLDVPTEYWRKYSHIQFSTQAAPNVGGSYVHLLDGRECEVNIVFPNDLDPNDAGHYAEFDFEDFTIHGGDRWEIMLTVDFAGTVIDPELCAVRAQDVFISPVSVAVTRL